MSAKSIQLPSFIHGLTLRPWGPTPAGLCPLSWEHSLVPLCTSFVQGQTDAGVEGSEQA